MKDIPYVIIGVLLVWILILQECNQCDVCPDAIEIHDTIKGDSIPYIVTKEVPVPKYIDTGKTRWRYLPIDTMAILAKYFAEVRYNDTLKNDTSALIVLRETVSCNLIQERELWFQNRRITAINTTIIPEQKKRNKIFAGVFTGIKLNGYGFGPSLMLNTKRDRSYALSYDAINKDFYFTLYFKLQFNGSNRK